MGTKGFLQVSTLSMCTCMLLLCVQTMASDEVPCPQCGSAVRKLIKVSAAYLDNNNCAVTRSSQLQRASPVCHSSTFLSRHFKEQMQRERCYENLAIHVCLHGFLNAMAARSRYREKKWART